MHISSEGFKEKFTEA